MPSEQCSYADPRLVRLRPMRYGATDCTKRESKVRASVRAHRLHLLTRLMKQKFRKDGAMRLPLQIALATAVLASATPAAGQMRYAAMDTNRDGTVTRSEWRGTDRAFRAEDWNGDGVLSGDEVRQGARRQNWSQDWNRDGRVDNL